MKCPVCNVTLEQIGDMYQCPNDHCVYVGNKELWEALIHTHKVLDKGMEHITGLNNMIESWYKLLQSDKDTSTKYVILKSAIGAYVENKGGNND